MTCLLTSAAQAVTQYTITDLGSLDGSWSVALGINASGQVVGYASTAMGYERAFLWENGVMQDLGSLGDTRSRAAGINASGQVVGMADAASGGHPVLWQNGVIHDLGPVGNAWGINASGQVAGWMQTASVSCHAYLWENGVMHDLGTLGGTLSRAYDINASGQVVGWAETATADHRAFLWGDGAIEDLGTLGGTASEALGINISGRVVGQAQIATGEWHAFLWIDDNDNGQSDPGEMQDLGTLGVVPHSRALSINASAQVVGYTYSAPEDQQQAFLWENGVIHELDSLIPSGSGWVLNYAAEINDLGQIVGYGYHNGQKRAFLLTPIPEPATVALAVVGVAGLLRRASRRRRG